MLISIQIKNEKTHSSIYFTSFFEPNNLLSKLQSRASKSYSNKELKEISQNNSNEIELLNYAIDHACYIVKKPVLEKTSNTSAEGTTIKLPFIEIKNQPNLDLKKVKFTDLQLKIIDRNQYFLIKDSNQMLVVKSKWVLQNEIDQIK